MKYLTMTALTFLTFSQAFAAVEIGSKPKCIITQITTDSTRTPTTKVQLKVGEILKAKGYTLDLSNDVLAADAEVYELHLQTDYVRGGFFPAGDLYKGYGEIKDLNTGVVYTTDIKSYAWESPRLDFEVKLARNFPDCGSDKK
jgi:hypothetical protein